MCSLRVSSASEPSVCEPLVCESPGCVVCVSSVCEVSVSDLCVSCLVVCSERFMSMIISEIAFCNCQTHNYSKTLFDNLL